MSVKIKGLGKLNKKLAQLPEEIREAAGRAVKAETEEAADDMRRFAPRDTGALAESVQAEYSAKSITGKVAATARHAAFVNDGTADTPAQPFANQTAERVRRRFRKRVETEVRKDLRK